MKPQKSKLFKSYKNKLDKCIYNTGGYCVHVKNHQSRGRCKRMKCVIKRCPHYKKII